MKFKHRNDPFGDQILNNFPNENIINVQFGKLIRLILRKMSILIRISTNYGNSFFGTLDIILYRHINVIYVRKTKASET